MESFSFLRTSSPITGSYGTITSTITRRTIASDRNNGHLQTLLALSTFHTFTPRSITRHSVSTILSLTYTVRIFRANTLIRSSVVSSSSLHHNGPSTRHTLTASARDSTVNRNLNVVLNSVLTATDISVTGGTTYQLNSKSSIISTFLGVRHRIRVNRMLSLTIRLGALSSPRRLTSTSLGIFH